MIKLSGERRTVAIETTGFMPEVEGDALFDAALAAGKACPGLPMVEIGAYLTGIVYPDRIVFPADECSAYTGAAVILAANAISGDTAASQIFGASTVLD